MDNYIDYLVESGLDVFLEDYEFVAEAVTDETISITYMNKKYDLPIKCKETKSKILPLLAGRVIKKAKDNAQKGADMVERSAKSHDGIPSQKLKPKFAYVRYDDTSIGGPLSIALCFSDSQLLHKNEYNAVQIYPSVKGIENITL